MYSALLQLNRALLSAQLLKSSDVVDPRPFYAAVMVVDRLRGTMLLGRRKEDGMWTSPGGAGNVGENAKQAAIRESFEEAALQFQPEDLEELPAIPCKDGKVCHVYLAYVDSEAVQVHSGNDPDGEVPTKDWKWLDLNAPAPKTTPERLQSINNAKMKIFGLTKSLIEALTIQI